MINPWIFEFMQVPNMDSAVRSSAAVTAVFDEGFRIWLRLERLGFEGIFFSEHHFGLSYSPSPNLLLASIARHTTRLRLGTMGMVAPFYEPWRIVEELIMLDHLTGGRLEIGMAAGVPQELVQIGLSIDEARERFNEILDILDAALLNPVINHKGKHWQFENLAVLPNAFVQPLPPKWTTVVSPASARKSAQRRSKICTGFESIARITEIFDAYRDEAARQGASVSPDNLGIRRHVSVSRNSAEARADAESAKAATMKVVAADPRVASRESALLDAPKAGSGFTIHADEFIAGNPGEVAEQIIDQCRKSGAGHFLAMLGRSLANGREENVVLFGEEVIPRLRRANIG